MQGRMGKRHALERTNPLRGKRMRDYNQFLRPDRGKPPPDPHCQPRGRTYAGAFEQMGAQMQRMVQGLQHSKELG